MTDHTDFIARHHRPPEGPGKPPRQGSLTMTFALIAAYALLCLVVVAALDIRRELIISAGAVFIVTLAFAVLARRLYDLRSSHARERALMAEVLEGSRG